MTRNPLDTFPSIYLWGRRISSFIVAPILLVCLCCICVMGILAIPGPSSPSALIPTQDRAVDIVLPTDPIAPSITATRLPTTTPPFTPSRPASPQSIPSSTLPSTPVRAATVKPIATSTVPPTPKPAVTQRASSSSASSACVRTGAVCNDGTTSTATGQGACSGHGGVKYWTCK